MKSKISLLALLSMFIVIAGCQRKAEKIETQYDRPLRPGQQALRKITDPYQIPDFTMASLDLDGLREAIAKMS